MSYRMADENISQDDMDALADWLRGGPWLTQGKLVREFEERWSGWLGKDYSAFVNSGSSANLLMYQVLKNLYSWDGFKIIVPAVGWATTIAPALQLGFDPIPCDASPKTFGLDIDHLTHLCETHEPGAVILVHVLGVPCQMDEIMALRDKYGFVLLEDCCAAHGSTYKGRKIGTFGDMASFSFFYGHAMTTIEGGMVSTNNLDFYDHLLMSRSHGWSKDLDHAKRAELEHGFVDDPLAAQFSFYVPGYNVRSTDLNAFLGLRQLETLDQMIAARASNHILYQTLLRDEENFRVQNTTDTETASISFAATCGGASHRASIWRRLRDTDIECRPIGGGNMTRQPFWTHSRPLVELPMADTIHGAGFHVPNHPGLTEQDIRFIVSKVIGQP